MARSSILTAFAIGLAMIGASACQKKEGAGTTATPKVINVAVSPASPPNLFEENGKTQGLDYDIFDGYCKARGCTMPATSRSNARFFFSGLR